MASITLKGNPVTTVGDLPAAGAEAPDFTLISTGLGEVKLSDFKGKKVVLNIFPSIDTPVCATSTKTFNEKAASVDGAQVVCVSMDLPFAFKRFCGAEGIDKVQCASAFRHGFGKSYGVAMSDGPLQGLLSRAVVVIDGDGKVVHAEQVPEIAQEPDYDAALKALQ